MLGDALVAKMLVAAGLLATPAARAGGPKYVAGTSYFNRAQVRQPVRWAGGQAEAGSATSAVDGSVAFGYAIGWVGGVRQQRGTERGH